MCGPYFPHSVRGVYLAKIIHNNEELLKKQLFSSISRLGFGPMLEIFFFKEHLTVLDNFTLIHTSNTVWIVGPTHASLTYPKGVGWTKIDP